jgi:hypothetical protein
LSDANTPKTDVIFLFGAGASVDAGIPDTYTFIVDFKKYVKQFYPEFSDLLSTVIDVREKYNEKRYGKEHCQVDIEQLLETLSRLIDRETDPLLDFYCEKKFSIANKQDDFVELKKRLENFVRVCVTIEDESKLEYLKELLSFDKPLEIFSTNYDTCIEQLSHIHYKRYTDGFDVYWNAENFDRNFDVKHYKMHGSVIWYESLKTKECVKIPVHAFQKGKPIELKLIYGEDVKPLVIYPAQKAEYIEPLTDLQLMFKKRLFSEATKFLVVVGYSFRDDYIIHMLWDAARVNENLHVVLISPNAQQIFENKLKYINKETSDPSRIHDRVLCLPYPFCTVIYKLRNQYLRNLAEILSRFQTSLEVERSGVGEPNWKSLVKLCIETEFLTKSEYALQKANMDWQDLPFGPSSELLLYGFKALLHSVICKDGYENTWMKRVNQTLDLFRVENLDISDTKGGLAFFSIGQNGTKSDLGKFLKDWISPLISEKRKKVELLTPKFTNALERISNSLEKLEAFHGYLSNLEKGANLSKYVALESDSPEVKSFIGRIEIAKRRGYFDGNKGEPNSIILGVERGRLKSFLGGESFRLELK